MFNVLNSCILATCTLNIQQMDYPCYRGTRSLKNKKCVMMFYRAQTYKAKYVFVYFCIFCTCISVGAFLNGWSEPRIFLLLFSFIIFF